MLAWTLLSLSFISSGVSKELSIEFQEKLEGTRGPAGCFYRNIDPTPALCDQVEQIVDSAKSVAALDFKGFERAILKILKSIRSSSSYHYVGVLLASQFRTKSMIQELTRISELEKKRVFPVPHATQALQRIQKGRCPASSHRDTREICNFKDEELDEIRKPLGPYERN